MTRQEILDTLSRRELTLTIADRLYSDMEQEKEVNDDLSDLPLATIDDFCDLLDNVCDEITDHLREMLTSSQ